MTTLTGKLTVENDEKEVENGFNDFDDAALFHGVVFSR